MAPAANASVPAVIVGEAYKSPKKKKKNQKKVEVKCPVMGRDGKSTKKTEGEYIYGSGKDKAAAVKDANDKLGKTWGDGYRLKHCRKL